jgi:peptide/nickel transport system permease protein
VMEPEQLDPEHLEPKAAEAAGSAVTVATPDTPGDEATGTRKQIRREQWSVLLHSPGFIIGMLILAFWTISALFPGLLANWSPDETVRNSAGESLVRDPPSSDAWFGTDRIGRDVYSRVIYGARPVLIVAPIGALIAVVAGTLLGMLIGYYRGWVDEIVSRIIEGFLSIPVILLAIIVLFTFGRSRGVIILTIAVLFTPVVTRTVRSATLSEGQLDYVTSAKMRGESGFFIITREILPNITPVAIVELTVRIAFAVFTVATLAFLGLAAGDATAADWGVDVANNYELIVTADKWWPSVFPALAIASLVIAVNVIADSIAKATSS